MHIYDLNYSIRLPISNHISNLFDPELLCVVRDRKVLSILERLGDFRCHPILNLSFPCNIGFIFKLF